MGWLIPDEAGVSGRVGLWFASSAKCYCVSAVVPFQYYRAVDSLPSSSLRLVPTSGSPTVVEPPSSCLKMILCDLLKMVLARSSLIKNGCLVRT
jgi:hypothetical protein